MTDDEIVVLAADFKEEKYSCGIHYDELDAVAFARAVLAAQPDAKDAARYREMKETDFSLEYCEHVRAVLNEEKGIDLDAAIDRVLNDTD